MLDRHLREKAAGVIPHNRSEWLECIARETARMAYPGSMSRGKSPVVHAGAKAAVERYFATRFPLAELFRNAGSMAARYDAWHDDQTRELGRAIADRTGTGNRPRAVAAKFLDTFMHQLMKYEPARPLWPALHLPLDRRVFAALSRLRSPTMAPVAPVLRQSPYRATPSQYRQVQRALLSLMTELNMQSRGELQFESRIELNWLWL